MTYSAFETWSIIAILGVVTFLIRFSFLGVIGDRALPPFALRLLRYTAVAVIPGMVAPLVLWPQATGGQTDPARLCAALVTLGLGLWMKNMVIPILAGGATLYLLLAIL